MKKVKKKKERKWRINEQSKKKKKTSRQLFCWLETIKEIKEKQNNHKSELNTNKENEHKKRKR